MSGHEAILTWHRLADVRTTSPKSFAIGFVLMAFIFGLALLFRDYWIAGFAVAFAAGGLPVLFAPSPRLSMCDRAVGVRQKRWFLHSFWMFPLLMIVAGASLTVQAVIGSPTGGDARLPYIAALTWLLAVLTAVHAMRNRGELVVAHDRIAVGQKFDVRPDEVDIAVVQVRKLAFPQLELTGPKVGAKKRVLYPAPCFGLEANSVYSTLRHLAETDEETRRNYSPELIREMLLFTPDREVAVGESIEVRIVARPEARAA